MTMSSRDALTRPSGTLSRLRERDGVRVRLRFACLRERVGVRVRNA